MRTFLEQNVLKCPFFKNRFRRCYTVGPVCSEGNKTCFMDNIDAIYSTYGSRLHNSMLTLLAKVHETENRNSANSVFSKIGFGDATQWAQYAQKVIKDVLWTI